MPSMTPSVDETTLYLESDGADMAGGSSGSSTARGVRNEKRRQTRPLFAATLVSQWKTQAEKANRRNGYGPLSTLDKQAIALRACKALRDMDLQSKGRVDMEEWLHHALLKHSGATAVQINSSLREALKHYPRLLEDLQRLFRAADVGQSGFLTLREVIPMYSRKLWNIQPTSAALLSEQDYEDLHSSDPEELARGVMKDMDFDGDNEISYAEFMAFCLGRRKQEVVLHMYDVSAGFGKSFVPLLGEGLQHWWHTGVVVYNREYFWACEMVHDDPGKTSFGVPMKVISLGHTLWRQDEAHNFIVEELQPMFHRESYDIIKNNCNHFSDRFVKFLVGRRLPDEVLNQDETLQKSTTIKIVSPLLQLWSRETINKEYYKSHSFTQPPKTVAPEDGSLLVPGSIVEIYPSDYAEAEVTLGIVCNQEQPRIMARRKSKASSPLLLCSGCNAVDTTTNQVWVRHFEIAFHRDVQESFGQVTTELIPLSRIAVVDLEHVVDETLYQKVLKMMNASSSQTRSGHGASGGLVGSMPSVPPGAMDSDDDVAEDLLHDFPDHAPFLAFANEEWAAMASPGRNQREFDAVKKLSSEGFSVDAAAAALSSTGWQIAEARALLLSRERLHRLADRSRSATGPSNCSQSPTKLRERFGKISCHQDTVNIDDALEDRSEELCLTVRSLESARGSARKKAGLTVNAHSECLFVGESSRDNTHADLEDPSEEEECLTVRSYSCLENAREETEFTKRSGDHSGELRLSAERDREKAHLPKGAELGDDSGQLCLNVSSSSDQAYTLNVSPFSSLENTREEIQMRKNLEDHSEERPLSVNSSDGARKEMHLKKDADLDDSSITARSSESSREVLHLRKKTDLDDPRKELCLNVPYTVRSMEEGAREKKLLGQGADLDEGSGELCLPVRS